MMGGGCAFKRWKETGSKKSSIDARKGNAGMNECRESGLGRGKDAGAAKTGVV